MSRSMLLPRWLPLFVIASSLAASASAQEVGDFVVVQTANAALGSPDKPTGPLAKGELLHVRKVEKDRFLARFSDRKLGGIEGWINRADVLPLSRALETLNDELKQKPTATAYLTRGWIREVNREHDKALADCNEAIRLDPKQAKAYSCRSVAQFYRQQFDQGISDLTKAIRLEPTSALDLVRRALLWRAKSQFVKAFADCDRALEINPSFALAHTGRAAVWTSRGQFGLAIAECGEAIRLDPKLETAYTGRAQVWSLKQEYAKAMSDYDQAVRLAPKSLRPYAFRGTCHVALEDYDLALADFDTAIGFAPNDFMPLVARAYLTATCPDAKYRDGKRSLKDAKKACELTDWKDGYCLEAVAAAYAENNDFLNAVKWQQKAIDLVPEKARQLRATLQYHMNLYKSQQPYHEKRD